MSACISPRGEFSDHVFGTEGDDRFVCSRCWTFAEDALLAALSSAEARVETLQRDYRKLWDLTIGAAERGPRPNLTPDTIESLRAFLPSEGASDE